MPLGAVLPLLLAAGLAVAAPSPAPDGESVDLSRPPDLAPFHARSPWRLIASQGPATTDYGGDPAPGALRLCLQRGEGACLTSRATPPAGEAGADWAPHYLRAARLVFPSGPGGPPLLELVTASLHAGDGGQVMATQLLRYRPRHDEFQRVFLGRTGTNNNQETRFLSDGPLRGAVISAEPTADAPYAYWITVSRPGADGLYRQVRRFRSATRYGDGDPLPVIDSEMPGVLRRLRMRRAGDPPPLPSGRACPSPRLKGDQLWCGEASPHL